MIFDEMKRSERKAEFLDKKNRALGSDPAYLQKMAEYIMTDRFDRDIDRLKREDYYMDPPMQILLRKGQSNRRRKVYKYSDENKMVLQYITFMLMEKYDDRFPDSLYSFRKHRSTGKLYQSIRDFDPDRRCYLVKADIHAYGESIDIDLLGKMLKEWMEDEQEVYAFIMWLISRNEFYKDDRLEQGFTSVIPGNPIAAFLQNIYLLDLDQYLTRHSSVCSRYSDDIGVLCEDSDSAEQIMEYLENQIHKLHLTFNEKKTGIVAPGQAFDLLGIKYGPDYTDISDNTYLKVCAKMKHRANKIKRRVERGFLTREEGLKMMASYIRQYYYGANDYGTGEEKVISWTDRFFPFISSDDRLRRLDHLSQECLRYIATGRRTNARYRFRYRQIRDLGYVPLVHAYYHRYDSALKN